MLRPSPSPSPSTLKSKFTDDKVTTAAVAAAAVEESRRACAEFPAGTRLKIHEAGSKFMDSLNLALHSIAKRSCLELNECTQAKAQIEH